MTADVPVRPALLTYEQAAAYLTTTPRHVRVLKERGAFPHLKVGQLVRFRPDDLDAYLDSRVVRPEP